MNMVKDIIFFCFWYISAHTILLAWYVAFRLMLIVTNTNSDTTNKYTLLRIERILYPILVYRRCRIPSKKCEPEWTMVQVIKSVVSATIYGCSFWIRYITLFKACGVFMEKECNDAHLSEELFSTSDFSTELKWSSEDVPLLAIISRRQDHLQVTYVCES